MARRYLRPVLAVVVVVLAGHVWSLDDGLFGDDHGHRDALRRRGWGFSDLIDSATISVSDRLLEMWWQTEPLESRYSRPVTMLAQKVEYAAAGRDPVRAWVVHAFGIAWHATCTILVYALAVQVFGRTWPAVFAAGFFALNPHSAVAVGWTASRNALISTAFTLLAVLFYIRASRLCLLAHARHEVREAASAGPVRTGWCAATLVAWVFALFSRELAVVVPGLLGALDLAFGGWRHCLRRWRMYLVLVGMLAAFLLWRFTVIPHRPVPNIYFFRPEDSSGVVWLLARLIHQLLCIAVYTPMLAGPFTAAGHGIPWLLVGGMVVPVAGVGLWYAWSCRGMRRGMWYWPAFVVIGLVPLVPVFTMPHFAYLSVVGYSVMVTVILLRLPRRMQRVGTGIVVAMTLWSFGLNRVAWRGVCRTEQLLMADAAAQRPSASVRDIVFIDLPAASLYVMLPLREVWHRPDLVGHALTFAPDPVKMTQVSTIVQRDTYRFTLSVDGPAYFSDLCSRILMAGMRPEGTPRAGLTVSGDLFDATVDATDGDGVRRLTFTFHRPLADESLCFFRSGPHRPAWRVRFRGATGPFPWTVPHVDPAAPEQRRWQARNADALAAGDRYFRILSTVRRIVRSDLFLTGKR